ncbi:FMN-dependent NADH-azoreductase [Tritonibacter horizontis]|uniref:FMN dependent NADH:quinone oxidoreductase n=1 Tax=Tritonibacter horizontis TaxID=1768241 RepID=A0A132BUI0_9RHOB|nr:NAD(P)H-dependent oxidoreductase [Tritonibacter horizontis]KUP91866.1 FMN-dependent NADH-azoreductase [Tritonibacter horizontis]
MAQTVLHIDSSARLSGSTSRDLTAQVVERLGAKQVIRRDLATPLPMLDEAWIGANFTPADQRTDDQKATLALSDTLVAELQAADTIVLGAPIYNFTVPTNLKAWIDLVARAGVTFRYTEAGPEGLLTGKRVVLVIASGGTEAGSDIDFACRYLRHMLGFIGLTEVELVAADQQMVDAEGSAKKAQDAIAALAA